MATPYPWSARQPIYLLNQPRLSGARTNLLEIMRQLGETRLLILPGPGGIGKTRLELRITSEMGDEFEHGCFFVSLAPLRLFEHLIQTVAEDKKFPLATHEDPSTSCTAICGRGSFCW